MEYQEDLSELTSQTNIAVIAPSGANFYVLSEQEENYFNDISLRYTQDNKFTNVADLQDLDRILIMELLCWRWGQWLSQEHDYWGEIIDSDTVRKQLNDYSKEIRLLKKSLGMDKPSRDREKGESVSDYIETLRVRAKEFGVMRNNQAIKAIELFQELQSLVTYHNNCTEDERREENIELHDILDWLVNTAFPEFNEIDENFRNTSQKYWDRER